MVNYYAYVLGRRGHIMKRFNFKADDDKAALEHARGYAIVSSVEVWHEDRLVGTVEPDDAA